MKTNKATNFLSFLFLFVALTSCGNPRSNSEVTALLNPPTSDTTITDVITGLWWENGLGEGGLNLKNTQNVELNISLKDGNLNINTEVNDIFNYKSGSSEYIPNSKYIDMKVKITYVKKSVVGQPKVHRIKNIEVIVTEPSTLQPKIITGFITGVRTNDSTCITLQKNMDEPVVEILRLYQDEQNLQQVNIEKAKDIFTYKNYMTQLNPKFASKKIKVTLEPKIITNTSFFNSQKRTEKFKGYTVTKIEFIN